VVDLSQTWLTAPTDLVLSSGNIHVWKIELQSGELQLKSWQETLSRDEVSRAERFHFPIHRQRFIIGRGSLRYILSYYLGVEPAQVQFAYQQHGKPILADRFAESRLCFNLAHSQDLALCAVNYQHPIGVDLEYIRSLSDVESLAQRFFLPGEYDLLRSLPPDQRQHCFFRYWTCKEAYLKATGDGLIQLEQVEVCLQVGVPARLLVSDQWSLREFVPADSFVAAIASLGNCENLQFWQYSPPISPSHK
jgi:4'-phosphopantetheinyl transferase